MPPLPHVGTRHCLVVGLSGTGKTSVCRELARRGYTAIDADDAFGYYGDPATRVPTPHELTVHWFWDADKVVHTLASRVGETVIVCGGAMNQDEVMHLFAKVFTLVIDDDTMRRRMMARGDREEMARHLGWNEAVTAHAVLRGHILIDATQPLDQVVDQLLAHMSAA